MIIQQQLEQDIKTALLAGDKDTVTVLRGLKSALLYAAVELKRPDKTLSPEEAVTVFQREAKKRQDSADLYQKAADQARMTTELAEKSIIERYLPAQLSDDELDKIITETAASLDDMSPVMMGKLIGQVKQAVGGQAEGARIAARVNQFMGRQS